MPLSAGRFEFKATSPKTNGVSPGNTPHPKQSSVEPEGRIAEPPPSSWWSKAVSDVLIDRHQQLAAEGHVLAHDAAPAGYELAHAAACYAYPELTALVGVKTWPWPTVAFNVRDRRSNLVRAAALLISEIEQLDRASAVYEQCNTRVAS